MPELPEVESVRRGLERHLTGRTIAGVQVFHPRPLRRQSGGPDAFARAVSGRTMTGAVRRGKLLWLPLDDGRALAAHLGMSGQLLVRGTRPPADGERARRRAPLGADAERPGTRVEGRGTPLRPGAPGGPEDAPGAPAPERDPWPRPRHLRVRLHLEPDDADAPGGAALDFVDQRMFGGLHVVDLVSTDDGAPGGLGSPQALLPADATHIARDLLDPDLDGTKTIARIRASRRPIKTLLLDQGIVSGVGNIYADEGLWAASIHGLRPGQALGPLVAGRLLASTAQVMERALTAGGTSFDALYVDAEGTAGYFARELAAYGRAGQECRRCKTVLCAETIGGRSHVFCPRCQRRPRR